MSTPPQLSALMTAEEVAQFLNISTDALEKMRSRRQGPPFFAWGRTIRYNRNRVIEWVATREVKTTDTTKK